MAFTKFSTEKADYVLDLGFHKEPKRRSGMFDGIDALIMETGDLDFRKILKNTDVKADQRLIAMCGKNKIPIYSAEGITSKFGDWREVWEPRIIPIIKIISFFFENNNDFYADSRLKYNERDRRIYSNYQFFMQSPMVEGRNAFHSEKIENYIADRVYRKVKKKPKIGLVYGAAHSGIRDDILSAKRRNITIWNYRNLNFRKYSGFVQDQLNIIYEANYIEKSWKIKKHKVNLFN